MKSDSADPYFRFSRSPAEALLAQPERNKLAAGFSERGFVTLNRFLRSLANHRQVEYTNLRANPRRFKDAVRTDFTCTVTIEIKFKRRPLIQSSGHGYGASAREAKLIALAESLERLGFYLRGWHDADPRASANSVLETPASDNTNGSCFHISPLSALKGAFCELLERDAFLAAWYSGSPLPVTRITQGHQLSSWARGFAAEGWELREHCWVHDRVPAVIVGLSLVRMAPAKDQWNFFFGSGAAPGVKEAQDKALKEMLKGRRQCSHWTVRTSGRATPAHLRYVLSRRILYQRPAFVRKFLERLALRPRAAIHDRGALSDRDFVAQCFTRIPSAKVVPLLLPGPFTETSFCVQIVCDELQGIDWQTPPRYNFERIQGLYGTPPRSVCRVPHPLA